MSSAHMSYYLMSGAHPLQGSFLLHSPTISYSTSPTFTTLNVHSPNNHSPNNRHLPQLTLTPHHPPSPLPPLMVTNFPSPGPMPLALTSRLVVDPLVAASTELYSSKVHYDVSKEPRTARVSACGVGNRISDEQKDLLVVEGAMPGTKFHITFDHPFLKATMERDSSPTIGRLIRLLYSYFQTRLELSDKSSLELNMGLYSAAVENQRRRCETAYDPDKEWREGMKWIDVLGKGSKFRGVELDVEYNICTLHVAFGK